MQHINYLQPWGHNTAVKIDCTCGESHGLISFRNYNYALASGYLAPSSVRQWADDPRVSPLSRELGQRADVLETVSAAWIAR